MASGYGMLEDPRFKQNNLDPRQTGYGQPSPGPIDASRQTQAERYKYGVSPGLVGKGGMLGMSDMDFADMVIAGQQGNQEARQRALSTGIDQKTYFERSKQNGLSGFVSKWGAPIAMGALTMGAGLAAGGGAGGASAGGAQQGLSMGATGASGLSTGASGATGLNPWVASGTMSSQMPAYAAYGAGAGGGGALSAMGSGADNGVNFMGGEGLQTAGTPSDFGAGASTVGDYSSLGGTSGQGLQMGGGTGFQATGTTGLQAGGMTAGQGAGGILGSGITGSQIFDGLQKYGPVIFAGMEYANARDAAQAYQQQLEKQMESSDPFGPERAQYQKQLQELMTNPESFMNSPQVKFASDAAARKMASMGYNMSPTQSQAIADASIGKYYEQAQLLAGLSGSNISPNMGALNQATMNSVGGQYNQNAALSNAIRTAGETFFGGGNTGGEGNTQNIGGRSFGILDMLD